MLFDFVDVSFVNKKFSLIPNEYFTSKELLPQFKLSNHLFKSEFLRFNVLPNLSHSVLVFNYDENIEYYLMNKFENVRIIHSGVRSISNFKSNNEEYVQLVLHKSDIEILAYKKGALQLYTIEDYSSYDDILYHVINIKNQLDMTNESRVVLLGNHPQIFNIANHLIKNKVSAKLGFQDNKENALFALIN